MPAPRSTAMLHRLRPPRQARSRESRERVLDAFAAMLAEQPFEKITIATLARRARVAVTSIYARFDDKRALVLALHERHFEQTMRQTAALLDPARWEGADLETVVRGVVAGVVTHLRPRAALLRAALLVNDPDVEARVAELMRRCSELLAQLLRPRLRHLPADARDRAVDFAIRTVLAVLQQRLLFPRSEPGRFHFRDAELTRRLCSVFLAAVHNP